MVISTFRNCKALDRVRPRLHLLEDRIVPAAGMLDPTFHGDGLVTTALGGAGGVAHDSLGRIVVVSSASVGSNTDFAVARYTSDGNLDRSFDGDGKMTFEMGFTVEFAVAVAVDSLDRIVVAGRLLNGPGYDFAVARLTVHGALDATFNGTGKAIIAFPSSNSLVYAVAVDSLDRVIVAGTTTPISGPGSTFAVARLTATGALDSSFDGDGRITFGSGFGRGVAVDSLDRIVVAGWDYENEYDFSVARLTTTGSFDNSFSGDGRLLINFALTNFDYGHAVAIDSLGRIVVAGTSGTASQEYDFAVVRLTTAGALDSSFDGDGRATIDFGLPADYAFGVDVDASNRIILAGETSDGGLTGYDFAAARLTAGGAPDTSFDGDGRQTFDFGPSDAYAVGVSVDAAGRAVVAGSTIITSNFEIAIGRLTGDTTTAVAQVNDGSFQRSKVTSLAITFSAQVSFSGPVGNAFTLIRNGGKPVSFSATPSVVNGVTVVTLANFSGMETEWGSLRDGRFTLTGLSSQITSSGQMLDGDANGTPGGNLVFGNSQGLFRMFGDFSGDAQVDGVDFSAFSSTYGLFAGNAAFIAAFDVNGDGQIDGVDVSAFSGRFNTVLP
jgi:uncharacterized delta-60 repeat protein